MISYDPLFKTLIDRKMSKSQLREKARLSKATFAKLSRNESVTVETLEKICIALECPIQDVVEIKQASGGTDSI